jgi:hypothetical protein
VLNESKTCAYHWNASVQASGSVRAVTACPKLAQIGDECLKRWHMLASRLHQWDCDVWRPAFFLKWHERHSYNAPLLNDGMVST